MKDEKLRLGGRDSRPQGKGDSLPVCRQNNGVVSPRRFARGHATTEYALCALLLVLALFAPYDGDQSVVDKLMEAIRESHAAQVHAIGNPVVGSSVSFSGQEK
jgi:hypothetical protein